MKKFFILFFLLSPCFLFSFSPRFSLYKNNNWYGVTARLSDYQPYELFHNINQGFIAEINFYFKLYQKQKAQSVNSGDKLLFEIKRVSRAYKDYFDNQYIVLMGEEKKSFSSQNEFISFFLSMKIDKLIQIESADNDFYLMSKIELRPVVLNSPLHLIEILNPITKSTSWVRLEMDGR